MTIGTWRFRRTSDRAPRRAVLRRRPRLGHPTEHVLRQTYIALHLAERLAMDGKQREVVYYASMLAWCHIDAYEQAKWFGDDQAFKHDAAYLDVGDALGSVAFLLRHIGDGRPLAERVRPGLGSSPMAGRTSSRCT